MQQEEEWEILSVDMLRTAIALLPHRLPKTELTVLLEDSTPTQAQLQQFIATIKQTAFEGKLRIDLDHSRDNFISCDEMVKDLIDIRYVRKRDKLVKRKETP